MNLEVAKNTELDNIQNVCRLCSGTVQLTSVFNKVDGPKPLVEIVNVLTTIQITKEDTVSQKMCHKCVSIIIKTYQFREQAIRNDENLKVKYAKLINSQQVKTEQTDVAEKTTKSKDEEKTQDVNSTVKPTTVEKPRPYVEEKPQDVSSKVKSTTLHVVHPSVTTIFKKHPTIRIPTICINSNISPTVVIELDGVENYLKRRNLSVNYYVNILTKEKQVARKSTSLIVSPSKNVDSREVFSIKINENEEDQKLGVGVSGRNSSSPKDIDVVYTTNRKRRRSDSSSSSHRSAKKRLIAESARTPIDSSPSPVPSVMNDISDLSFARSEKIHVCNICDAVYSNASNLKRHKFKHLSCQFCKKKFKTFALKDTHNKNDCVIQKIMKSMVDLPTIPLQKIECNVKIRNKFRKAFDAFHLIPEEDANRPKSKNRNAAQTELTSGIIEIISDEDNGDSSSNYSLFTEIVIKDKIIEWPTTDTDSDIELIQSLLSQYNKSNKKLCESSQTYIPTNSSIKYNHADNSIQLKFLKLSLLSHQIPIGVSYGSCLNISYKRNFGSTERKQLHHWDELACCDINFADRPLKEVEPIAIEVTTDIITYNDTTGSTEDEILVEDIYSRSVPEFYKISEKTTDKTSVDSEHETRVTIPGHLDETKKCQDEKRNSKNTDSDDDVVVIEDDAEMTEVSNSAENKIINTTKTSQQAKTGQTNVAENTPKSKDEEITQDVNSTVKSTTVEEPRPYVEEKTQDVSSKVKATTVEKPPNYDKTSVDSEFETKDTTPGHLDQTKNCQDEKANSKSTDFYDDVVVIEDDVEMTEASNGADSSVINTTKLDITGDIIKRNNLEQHCKSMEAKSGEIKHIKFVAKYKILKETETAGVFSEENEILIVEESSKVQTDNHNVNMEKHENKEISKECLATNDLSKTNTLLDHNSKDPSVEEKCTENKKSSINNDKMLKRISMEVNQGWYGVMREKSTTDKTNIQSNSITIENDTESEKGTSNNNQNRIGTDEDCGQTLDERLKQTNLEKENNLCGVIKKMTKDQKCGKNKIVGNLDQSPNKTRVNMRGTAHKNLKRGHDKIHTKATNKQITKNCLIEKDVGHNGVLIHDIELMEDVSKDLTNKKKASENTNSNTVDKKTAQTELDLSYNCEILRDRFNENMNKEIDLGEKSYEENILKDIIEIEDDESSEETVDDKTVTNGVDATLEYFEISDEEL
ncbi:putative leucine-rich repeat-containing protein DDB_G0290503 isoform X2 [Diabrotica virgifera virgifera]|uniref:ZAD domain-containing protein n=1 Tax=Diabrotica virgifera virgifera TaxID=50390 RepID=A0ABM5KU73_DIAVI|nr:putative leucine-rich repeat-containing protein DDB_G0290503 isoform X2 [Diabrotica virgifera virgifera]